VLGERNEGFIQMTYLPESMSYEGDGESHAERHYEDLARISGRPILYNVVLVNDAHPDRFRHQLAWLDSCRSKGLRVYGQAETMEQNFAFTFKDWNLWDDMPAWRECTRNPELKKYENQTIGEIATTEGKHPVDVLLDIAVTDGLNAEFYTPSINQKLEH